jgi:hypothetical protein
VAPSLTQIYQTTVKEVAGFNYSSLFHRGVNGEEEKGFKTLTQDRLRRHLTFFWQNPKSLRCQSIIDYIANGQEKEKKTRCQSYKTINGRNLQIIGDDIS